MGLSFSLANFSRRFFENIFCVKHLKGFDEREMTVEMYSQKENEIDFSVRGNNFNNTDIYHDHSWVSACEDNICAKSYFRTIDVQIETNATVRRNYLG